jgi:hypothetical protein
MGVNSAEEMRIKAREKYREHYALIRRIVPREGLLEYKLGSDWKPLCEFLGKEIPNVEFPRVNETGSMHEKMSIIVGREIRNILKRALLWIEPLMIASFFWKVIKLM